ncbi:DUF397 domain-containing protein [Streptomyces sp. UNOC14_S4]|uniref:DUF397 domain-containing protein n=1 Tax=Streptomyces sp. UNOC14_S4 TaxID=2872340 RepID=UPI001E4490EF|nr:DUF397 domain-containing protein [Streptomyces sp. UNOC14_S4]MCC3769355.1 DUF397 domain-containing protein [Streptomyces sp. UNOC14_S4]
MSIDLVWFKSSFSDDEGAICVEVAVQPQNIHIRDSKRRGAPHFTVAAPAWAYFISARARSLP